MNMHFRITAVLLAGLMLFGCSLLVEKPAKVAARPAVKPKALPHVVILVSQSIPPYNEVAVRLKQKLKGRASIHYLGNKGLATYLSGEQPIQLVTIGLDATRMSAGEHEYQHIFCQVFNYTENDLFGPRSKGVAMLPGVDKTFAIWKTLSPSLTDVAVISGPGQEDMLQQAVEVAAMQGITLQPVIVENDKEYQYAYKQLGESVQGYWLLPDNRVLSIKTLKDVMNFSVRNGKQVVVFNDELLRLGGLFSATSRYDDIADKVYQRLMQAAGQDEIPGPDLLPLEDVNLLINAVMARRLGIVIPAQYRKYTDAAKTP